MALVGVVVFAGYAAAAATALWVLADFLHADVSPLSVLFAVVAATLLTGFASYRFGTARVLSELDARALTPETSPELHRRLDALTERMAVGSPTVYVARMPLPNAISLGGPVNGAVVFDRTLFDILDADEFEGVLAHELAHLENRDSLVQSIAYSVARTVVVLVVVVFLPVTLLVAGANALGAWVRGRPFEPTDGGLRRRLGLLVVVVFVALTLLVRAHSRGREFAADERAAAVTGNPLGLASALRKIERASDRASGVLGPLYVRTDEETEHWLSTHPSMDDRIENLQRLAGGRRIEVE